MNINININESSNIDKYVFMEELGHGNFGTTYKAFDKINNSLVAIKKIKNYNFDSNEIDNLKILNEHCDKYFICLYDFIDDSSYVYIVMKYLENYNELFNLIVENIELLHINFDKITCNLCKGLQNFHDLGFAHNDIKPENIMVNILNGHIKYIDYGATCYKNKCIKLKVSTPAYADPLIILGKPNSDNILINGQQSDLWALGMVIYAIITGSNPYFNYGTHAYIKNYEYIKDKNLSQINKFLNKHKSNIILEKLLTRGVRTLY